MAGTENMLKTLERDESREALVPTADLSTSNSGVHTQTDGTSNCCDYFDHAFAQKPDDGGDISESSEARSITNSSAHSPESKKKPPQIPQKPAHLRKDSTNAALPPSPSTTSPESSYSVVAGLEPNLASISPPQPPPKGPVKPIKHEGIASLEPLPDWAQVTPHEEAPGSTWRQKGRAVLSQLPSTLKNFPSTVADKVRSATQSAPSITIAIMGVTGSGKSQFIQHVTGKDVRVSGQLSSCTAEIGCYATWVDGVCVTLIDTPGFDDTSRSEINVLETIACFMEAECKGNLMLNGIIYMHRITDIRMGGASTRNLRMFRSLCGEDNLPNVLLVTSMWDNLLRLPDGQAIGEKREAELVEKREFWGAMTEKGAKLQRHDGTRERAMEIIGSMMGKGKITTAIQKQLATGVPLAETEAGHVVNQMNTDKIKQMKAENQEAINEQKKINEDLQKNMQEAKETFERLQLESQQALQEAEELRRRQLSVSDEQKRELEEAMGKLKEKADKAQAEAEEQKKKAQDKWNEAAQTTQQIDDQVNTVNKAIAEREEAAQRLKMSEDNRRRFWLMSAAQSIGPVIEGFIAAGPIGALAVAGVSFVTNLLAGFAMF